jgi:catechol 2,3-dioxygenase-like lactoylglutathione lyase family enzyme
MLQDARIYAVLPAADLDRARRFYLEKLGLEPADENDAGLFYEGAATTRFLLYPTQGRTSGTHTQMGFLVDDAAATVAELRSRGVVFQDYDMPGLKTVDGIAEFGESRSAWFEDSEGNVVAIVEYHGG